MKMIQGHDRGGDQSAESKYERFQSLLSKLFAVPLEEVRNRKSKRLPGEPTQKPPRVPSGREST